VDLESIEIADDKKRRVAEVTGRAERTGGHLYSYINGPVRTGPPLIGPLEMSCVW
jgi:hypothetical protein